MLKLKNIKKSFGDLHVLKGVDLDVGKGEIVSIIGPSGSGKSTLLRTVNFLGPADQGEIQLGSMSLDSTNYKEKHARTIRKKASMVFQHYNLFNNKTVLENVTEGLKINSKKSNEDIHGLGVNLLNKVGLSDKLNSYPAELSGGQKQRVGIARALAQEPDIILFDEPTSALDPELIGEVLNVIRDLSKQDVSMLIVTHEMDFAREISDRIVFMDNGLIEVEGTPDQVFGTTENTRLQSFLGRFRKGTN